eukprot:12352352-Alexandrium_andersonii.AAC.1
MAMRSRAANWRRVLPGTRFHVLPPSCEEERNVTGYCKPARILALAWCNFASTVSTMSNFGG